MAEFSDTPQPPLLNPMSARSIHFDEEEISSQKNCIPGPNVLFSKKVLPFTEYVSNMTKPGTLGCDPDQYPKYTNGKYCCESTMATPQEQLDYVNMLLEYAIENVGQTAFKKYSIEINWLKNMRDFLLKKYKENNLTDTLSQQFPMTINGDHYDSLDDYISKNMQISNELALDPEYKGVIQGIGLENPGVTSMNTIRNKNIKPIYNQVNSNVDKEGGKGYRKTIRRKKSKVKHGRKSRKSHRRGRRKSKRSTKK